ncbi:MAG TPA: uroporphyrinogen decarboxylase [Candidatus Saccharimonadales bacterium]|nr:uroporphyrinogen decarboxylase [Candidatus Saccharimonadales bacterium]
MNTTFLDTCFSKKTAYTPVWLMRQAGRYLPEYKKLKANRNILDIIKIPELAAQICMQPVDILHVDAAVLYADIMIPLLGIDVDLEIIESIGPVITKPLENIEDVKKLRDLDPENDIPYLDKTIRILRNDLSVPLIGFSAAPFTLASYLIEGKPSRDFIKTKTFMYSQPEAWELLMNKLSSLIILYLTTQIKSGIQAIQIFDSWVGFLSEEDYIHFVLPYSKKIFKALQEHNIPLIHFGTNTAGMLKAFSSVGCDVVSIDWRMPLAKAWKVIGYQKAIQGNLDPAILFADFPIIKKRVDSLFGSLPKKEGYIFNLGHGVLPLTPVKNIQKLVEYVHTM